MAGMETVWIKSKFIADLHASLPVEDIIWTGLTQPVLQGHTIQVQGLIHAFHAQQENTIPMQEPPHALMIAIQGTTAQLDQQDKPHAQPIHTI